mmetsp:Transcript_45175/g.96051  ORF Transcript_45175/g.96051 Transcript_45175/m.96051 type:complete len:320 (-) Transcript_45175:1030-1989(-)
MRGQEEQLLEAARDHAPPVLAPRARDHRLVAQPNPLRCLEALAQCRIHLLRACAPSRRIMAALVLAVADGFVLDDRIGVHVGQLASGVKRGRRRRRRRRRECLREGGLSLEWQLHLLAILKDRRRQRRRLLGDGHIHLHLRFPISARAPQLLGRQRLLLQLLHLLLLQLGSPCAVHPALGHILEHRRALIPRGARLLARRERADGTRCALEQLARHQRQIRRREEGVGSRGSTCTQLLLVWRLPSLRDGAHNVRGVSKLRMHRLGRDLDLVIQHHRLALRTLCARGLRCSVRLLGHGWRLVSDFVKDNMLHAPGDLLVR